MPCSSAHASAIVQDQKVWKKSRPAGRRFASAARRGCPKRCVRIYASDQNKTRSTTSRDRIITLPVPRIHPTPLQESCHRPPALVGVVHNLPCRPLQQPTPSASHSFTVCHSVSRTHPHHQITKLSDAPAIIHIHAILHLQFTLQLLYNSSHPTAVMPP